MRASARHAPPTRYRSLPAASPSHGTVCRSASAIARARTGSPPERSVSRITPSFSVCDGPRVPVDQPHDLQRAAADIRQHAIGRRDAAQHAVGGVGGLLDTRQDMDRHAGHPLPQRRDKGRSVGGITHRRGRQHLERLARPSPAPPRGSGASPSVPAPCPRSFSRPVACMPRPSRSTAFSLKIGMGLRVWPSINHQSNGVGPKIDNTATRQWCMRAQRASISPGVSRSWRRRIGTGAATAGPCNADPRPDNDGLVMK